MEAEMTTNEAGAMHFTMKNLGASSRRFGACEVCGRDASEVFRQGVSQEYAIGEAHGRLDRGSLFGHEACLLGVRSDGAALVAALTRAGERA
jgi:hypothetical protein